MAGTNRSRKDEAILAPPGEAPVVVLVEPQLGENIGAAARAMLNFGLGEMRLVRPRGSWPNQRAIDMSSGAEIVLEQARLFDSTREATADLNHLFATTARRRDMVKDTVTPREAAGMFRRAVADGRRTGVLFGRERTGLVNEDVVLADSLIMIPANPIHASLNLAQAVVVIAYEWFQSAEGVAPELSARKEARPATREELGHFYDHLEGALEESGFFFLPERRARMVRNIRNIFARSALTDQEVRTLRGIINSLAERRKGRGKDGG